MKVLLTGGPCSGKTSILNNLQRNNPEWNYHSEIARELGKTMDPVNKPKEFTRAIYDGRINQYNSNAPVSIYDRGLIDCAAYELYFCGKDSENFQKYLETCKSHQYEMVFFMPHWPEIYKQDSERFETEQQASMVAESIKEVLQSVNANYQVVPTFKTIEKKQSISTRTEFITEKIHQYIQCNY